MSVFEGGRREHVYPLGPWLSFHSLKHHHHRPTLEPVTDRSRLIVSVIAGHGPDIRGRILRNDRLTGWFVV